MRLTNETARLAEEMAESEYDYVSRNMAVPGFWEWYDLEYSIATWLEQTGGRLMGPPDSWGVTA